MPQRYEHTGIVREEKKRNALDYADKSKLDVNHNRVEFPAAFTWRIHDATGNRLIVELSRREEAQRDRAVTGVFIYENPITGSAILSRRSSFCRLRSVSD